MKTIFVQSTPVSVYRSVQSGVKNTVLSDPYLEQRSFVNFRICAMFAHFYVYYRIKSFILKRNTKYPRLINNKILKNNLCTFMDVQTTVVVKDDTKQPMMWR